MSRTPTTPNTPKQPNYPIQFTLVGLAASISFQRCLAHIEIVHKKLPQLYSKPFIRPMLESDWLDYLVKAKRRYGEAFWYLQKPCVVFKNETYLGDDDDLIKFISLKIKLRKNYQCLATRGVLDLYEKFMQLGRKFAFLTISIDGRYIGHMIFMLYYDLVPKTCKNFIRKCNNVKHGYSGCQVHRIMGNSWIQFGEYKIPSKSRLCENYKIPHNRRGVLSMCNTGRHSNNTTQFFVCLDATPWMDFKYVAFGQLIQGDKVLRELEALETFYEYPANVIVRIAKAGEITMDDTLTAKQVQQTEEFIEKRLDDGIEMIEDPKDTPSILIESHYGKGFYSFETDNQNYEMINLRKELITPEPRLVPYFIGPDTVVEESEGGEDYTCPADCDLSCPYKNKVCPTDCDLSCPYKNTVCPTDCDLSCPYKIKHRNYESSDEGDIHARIHETEIIPDDNMIYNYIETGG